MTETRGEYTLKPEQKRATLSTEDDILCAQLRNIKRDLISLLLTVERALGDQPSIVTRAERRRG